MSEYLVVKKDGTFILGRYLTYNQAIKAVGGRSDVWAVYVLVKEELAQ
jgi:hypothetical protein